VTVWIHRKVAGALVRYEPISDRLIVVRLNAKPRNITLIQVYGPTTAATEEEMERFYQDLSRAVKQVPKGDRNGLIQRQSQQKRTVCNVTCVGLYGLGETNEVGE